MMGLEILLKSMGIDIDEVKREIGGTVEMAKSTLASIDARLARIEKALNLEPGTAQSMSVDTQLLIDHQKANGHDESSRS